MFCGSMKLNAVNILGVNYECIAIDRNCIGVNIETYIPKPPEDAGSDFRPDARSRRNMQRMVIPFSNVTTQS
jgi:hypothetical protein